MEKDYKQEIGALPQRTREELLEAWRRHFGKAAPRGVRRELLIPMIAYRIQDNLFGGLSEETKQRLRDIAEPLERRQKSSCRYQAGTRLIREWGGKRHEVRILDRGFGKTIDRRTSSRTA